MKKIFFVLFCFPIILLGQSNFHLGFGVISSCAKTIKNDKQYNANNKFDIGLYYGNDIKINNYLKTVIEVFYHNNRVILAEEDNKRFELHQNIGFGLKPGIYYKKHGINLITGILAVYIFDKDLEFGNQLDYFDDSFFYGVEYNYDIMKNLFCSFGFLYTDFEKNSNWTNHILKSFTVLQFTINYRISKN